MRDIDIYVLGIGITHDSTASLLKNGKIVAAASEERFVRVKNINTYPINAIKYVLEHEKIGLGQIALVVHGFQHSSFGGEGHGSMARGIYSKGSGIFSISPAFGKFVSDTHWALFKQSWKRNLISTLVDKLKLEQNRILVVDHHTCHAFAAYYGVARNDSESDSGTLTFTADAEGDGLCASISIGKGQNLTRVNSTKRGNSLAAIYAATTEVLGMKANEHEYKVMGLAPYASPTEVGRSYRVFDELISIDADLHFRSKLTYSATKRYLSKALVGHRFDGIAGAIQRLSEERITDWISRSVSWYSIHRIAAGGGFFMNVKANMSIAKLDSVHELHICPTAGDESVAIGAAYFGYELVCQGKGRQFVTEPFDSLYLGPEFSDAYIESFLDNHPKRRHLQFQKQHDIELVSAELLAKNEIVARFNGRMEWGARALGNRSILANPSDTHIVKNINERIKNRDFWMPFAPTIIKEREQDYVLNPKGIAAPFMALAFDTTKLAQRDLVATIHPYDLTARPQILERTQNPRYHDLIKNFEKITGIGAVLNTSFNLHGDPIVCSPTDALDTFFKSGLNYLAIGSFLVSKVRPD